MAMSNATEFVISRIIDAPREKVWKVWTEPEHLTRWWGPKDFTAPVCKIDLRVGGKYHYCMRSPDGREYWSGGVFKEIVTNERIVATDTFMDADGNVLSPAEFGLSPDFPKESLVTVLFEDQGGKTKLSIVYKLPESAVAREAMVNSEMEEGWNQSLDKFEAEASK